MKETGVIIMGTGLLIMLVAGLLSGSRGKCTSYTYSESGTSVTYIVDSAKTKKDVVDKNYVISQGDSVLFSVPVLKTEIKEGVPCESN